MAQSTPSHSGLELLFEHIQYNQKNELMDQVMTLLNANEFEEANYYLEILHKMEPEDVSVLMLLTNNYMKLKNIEQAEITLNKILQIDPGNLNALLFQGKILQKNGDYYNSIIYFDKVLKTDPENSKAKSLRLESQTNLNYIPINGMVEIIVRDSNGNLVSYYKSIKNIEILDHIATEPWLQKWPVTKTIMIDGKKFNVHQRTLPDSVEDYYYKGQFGLVKKQLIPDVFLLFSHYHMVIADKGDSVTYIYSWFDPIE